MSITWNREKYRLAVPEWCLPGDSIFSIKMASELGLDGLQIEAGFYDTGFKLGHPWVQKLYVEAAAQYGVQLISIVMNDLNNHGLRNGRGTEFGDIAYEGLDIALEAAEAMKIPVLMIPIPWKHYNMLAIVRRAAERSSQRKRRLLRTSFWNCLRELIGKI